MDNTQMNDHGPLAGTTTQEPGIHVVTNEKARSKSKQETSKPKGGQRRTPPPGKGNPKTGAKIAANFSGSNPSVTPNKKSNVSSKKGQQDSARRTDSPQKNGGVKGGTTRSTPAQANASQMNGAKKKAQGNSPLPGKSRGSPHARSPHRSKEDGRKAPLKRQDDRGHNRTPQKPRHPPAGSNDSPRGNGHKLGKVNEKNSRPNSRSPLPNATDRHRQSRRGMDSPRETAPRIVNSPVKKVAQSPGNKEGETGQASNGRDGQQPVTDTQHRHVIVSRNNNAGNRNMPVDSPVRYQHRNTSEEDKLERIGIFKLQKRKSKFPRANYFCRLCNYHMDNVRGCEEHAAQTRHIRLMKNKIVADNFADVPNLPPDHLAALSASIEALVADVGLSDDMLEERKAVEQRVNTAIKEGMQDCEVQLYGSSLSGFGFKTSDVNLNIKTTGKRSAAEMLVAAHSVLEKNNQLFGDIGCKFEDKFPVICFTDAESKLYCELGTGSIAAVATSQLLLRYRNHDPRARLLGVAFRHWARLLEIDRPQEGSVPPYVYSLMVVYFLQRCDTPLLPVFQENEHLTQRNVQVLGDLWVALFHFYLVERNLEEEVISIKSREVPTRKDLNIHSRRIIVDDPCTPSKKSIAKYLSSAEVFNYIMDCFHIALEYFTAFSHDKISSAEASLSSNQSEESPTHVNHIREESPPEISPAQTNLDEDAIVDSLNDLVLDDTSAVDDSVDPSGSNQQEQADLIQDLVDNEDNLSEAGNMDITDAGEESEHHRQEDQPSRDGEAPNVDDKRTEETKVIGDSWEDREIDESDLRTPEEQAISEAPKFNFAFDTEKLSGGQKVPKICGNCQLEGHISQDCEEDKLPELLPLPPMEDWYLTKIQYLCDYVSDQFSPDRAELEERSYVVQDLEGFLQYHSEAKIKLALFGSSVNGFGFQNSDLDICMTFPNNETGEGLNVPEIIQSLSDMLRKHRDLYSVIAITTAKVPIVKFTHRPTSLEGDISLYNLLAQRNTKLLYTYSAIDRRVCRVGHMVKAFAKECAIADASRGSLSSYAYILMTVFFLQQTRPPVIPVLQELHTGDTKPEKMVEGWNTWFYENVNKLPTVWKGLGKNRQSEAELFLGFLRFYTEEFDFDKFVVCIRQHRPLTRFEKMWMGTNKGFTIEDPFDLDHNLGGALSRRMSNYITVIFRQGRQRFGTAQKLPSRTYEFFFDYDFLTDGQPPPNDRGCRICGKIGHFVKDCPIKQRGKERRRAKAATATTPQKNPEQPQRQGTPTTQGNTPNRQGNIPNRQGNTPNTKGNTPNTKGNAPSKQTSSDATGKSEQSTRQKDPETSNKQPGSKQSDSTSQKEQEEPEANSDHPGSEQSDINSQESSETTATNKNNNQRERTGHSGEVKTADRDDEPTGAAVGSSLDIEEVVSSHNTMKEDVSQQVPFSVSRLPTSADVTTGGSGTSEHGTHSVNVSRQPSTLGAHPHHGNVAGMSQDVRSEGDRSEGLTDMHGAPLPSPVIAPHGWTPPEHRASPPTHYPAQPRHYQSPPGQHPSPPIHHQSPPRYPASPPRPIRTPDGSMPYHGTPPTIGSPSGQPSLPRYPGLSMSPHGYRQRMPIQFGQHPTVPQPSRELMMFMGMPQVRQGILGSHPGMVPTVHHGQAVPTHDHPGMQGTIPGQPQGTMTAGHGHSPQYVGMPPQGQWTPDNDRHDMARTAGTPPRQGNTPPRYDLHMPPRGITPPRHGATPPRSVVTPPQPLMASPATPYQRAMIPPLMALPVGMSPDGYPSSPMTTQRSTPPHAAGSPMMVSPQMVPGQFPGSPHGQMGPGQLPGSPHGHMVSGQFPGSPQGQMVYPNHPGASPLMMGQPHQGMQMVPSPLPQPLMGQQLPPMYMNGEMQLAQATVDLQQMLGMSPGAQVPGQPPQQQMGLASHVQGGLS